MHTAAAVLDVVDKPAPPRRMLLSAHVLPLVLDTSEQRIRTWRSQETRTHQAQ